MTWSAPNLSIYGAPNIGAYRAPNIGVVSGPNIGVHSGPNIGVLSGQNIGVLGSGNIGVLGSGNIGVLGAGNIGSAAAVASVPLAGGIGSGNPGTGAGSASGNGFIGGYGSIARFEYATPSALAPLPFSPDFTLGDGWSPYPVDQRLEPYAFDPPLRWQTGDWDPALRFWTLKFDPHLTEWLQDLDLSHPAVMAAREFAARHELWAAGTSDTGGTLSPVHEQLASDPHDGLTEWFAADNAGADTLRKANQAVARELAGLVDLMRDDRARYLEETLAQSGAILPYYLHLMGVDPASKPWTVELINCGSAIGNLVKMQYKAHYRRVRPSTLCPGLVPHWGPPQHPAFPSGHSTVAHLTSLLLLSVEGIAQRFGIYTAAPGSKDTTHVGRRPLPADMASAYGKEQHSPLLWLAWRIAMGRERLGLHYRSDSAAGRRLAALVWERCVADDAKTTPVIDVPTLRHVLTRARAEWPLLTLRGG